jgi:NAD(P)-dependent dehydrogenase (short-subunit alcohol dehydrogenase family)
MRKALLAGTVAYLGWKLFRNLLTPALRGRVVLITGGSRGLGLLLAREFVREGCPVVICARDEQELDRARRDLERRGGVVMARRCDVADRDQVEAMVNEALARFGRIDIVVNNAAIIQVGPFESMTLADFGRAMAVDFWGPFNVIWSVIPHMRARGEGRIVNITSIGGKVAVPHLLPYDCAKSALVALSEGLHAELAKDGIRVCTVVPGLMRTGSPVNALFKGNAEREFEWFSLGDSLAVSSMSATRAARRIVNAARYGEGEVVIGWQAKTVRWVHGVFPNLFLRLARMVNRLLPESTPGQYRGYRGMDLATPAVPSQLTRNMNSAARRLNQYGGRAKPSPAHAKGVIR